MSLLALSKTDGSNNTGAVDAIAETLLEEALQAKCPQVVAFYDKAEKEEKALLESLAPPKGKQE